MFALVASRVSRTFVVAARNSWGGGEKRKEVFYTTMFKQVRLGARRAGKNGKNDMIPGAERGIKGHMNRGFGVS